MRQSDKTPKCNKQTRVVLTNNPLEEVKYNPIHQNLVTQHSALMNYPELCHLMKTDHQNSSECIFNK